MTTTFRTTMVGAVVIATSVVAGCTAPFPPAADLVAQVRGLAASTLPLGRPARAEAPPDREPHASDARVAPVPPAVAAPGLSPRQGFADLVESVKAAVVNLEVVSRRSTPAAGFPRDGAFEHFFGFRFPEMPREQIRQGQGSGFLIDPAGLILSNHHVVDGAERIRVRLDDGRSYDASVLGSDSLTDLALVKIDGEGSGEFPGGARTRGQVSDLPVVPDSPGARAGLKPQDVIVEVDGERVEGARDVTRQVGLREPDARVKITVHRDGRERKLTAVLGERPDLEGIARNGVRPR